MFQISHVIAAAAPQGDRLLRSGRSRHGVPHGVPHGLLVGRRHRREGRRGRVLVPAAAVLPPPVLLVAQGGRADGLVVGGDGDLRVPLVVAAGGVAVPPGAQSHRRRRGGRRGRRPAKVGGAGLQVGVEVGRVRPAAAEEAWGTIKGKKNHFPYSIQLREKQWSPPQQEHATMRAMKKM